MRISGVTFDNEDAALALFRDTTKKTIVVFRHPSIDDPPLVYDTVQRLLIRAGRRREAPVFLYGRDVPVWGGGITEWILPRVGAISVFHEQVRRDSLDAVYDAFRRRKLPVALAPEAQITYHNYRVAPTQRGVAHLAVEAARARADDPETVVILPVAPEYRYPDTRHRQFAAVVERVTRRLTADAGGADGGADGASIRDGVAAVWDLADHLFRILERHYRLEPAVTMNDRMRAIVEAALYAGEKAYGVESDDAEDTISRVFRLRSIYWERRFPMEAETPLERDLQDLVSVEARGGARHFQIVDVMAYLDFDYLLEVELHPDSEMPHAGSARHARLVEYLLSIDDVASRALGGTIAQRYQWRGRRCTMRFGTEIPVSPPPGHVGRAAHTAELQQAIETALSVISVPG